MSKENNEAIERMPVVELFGYYFEVINKLWNGGLTKEEREKLEVKKHFLNQKLRERRGEFRELVKEGITLEERQQIIENMEFAVKRAKNLSPRDIERIQTIINDQKRRLEKIKSRKKDL